MSFTGSGKPPDRKVNEFWCKRLSSRDYPPLATQGMNAGNILVIIFCHVSAELPQTLLSVTDLR